MDNILDDLGDPVETKDLLLCELVDDSSKNVESSYQVENHNSQSSLSHLLVVVHEPKSRNGQDPGHNEDDFKDESNES